MVLNKKIVILISFFSLLICILTLQDTYAKYTSQAQGTTDIAIARWRILVNDFDVRQNITNNSIITPVFSGTEHIAPNIIAPTSEGYFDVIIDATSTDVSFDYTISANNNESSSVKDLIISGYKIDDGELIETENTANITGSINYNDQSKIHTIRVYVKWNDADNSTMDNTQDTNVTKNTTNAKIDLSVHFVQKVA